MNSKSEKEQSEGMDNLIFKDPWKNDDGTFKQEIYDNIEKYKKAYKSLSKDESNKIFSWVLQEDKPYINLYSTKETNESDEDSNKIISSKSNDFGIPNQIIGDPFDKDTNFFLCLLNARTRLNNDNTYDIVQKNSANGTKKVLLNGSGKSNNLHDYIHTENEEYKDGIFYSNAEYKENTDRNDDTKFLDMSVPSASENTTIGYIVPTKENQKEYFEDSKKYTDHIERFSGNQILDEVKQYQNDVKLNKIFNRENYYYLSNYYYFLLLTGEQKRGSGSIEQILKHYSDEKYNNVKVCDLELYPYRSGDAKTFRLKKGGYKNLQSSRYVASIIIEKIKLFEQQSVKDQNKRPLVFVFRAYDKWRSVIKYCLRQNNSNKEVKKIFLDYQEKYFYAFAGEKAALSETNIRKFKNGKKVRLESYGGTQESDYSKLRRSIGINL